MSKFSNYLKEETGEFGWVVLPSINSCFVDPSLNLIKWAETPKIVKKELTEKQLFDNVKKELKKVVNRTSAI